MSTYTAGAIPSCAANPGVSDSWKRPTTVCTFEMRLPSKGSLAALRADAIDLKAPRRQVTSNVGSPFSGSGIPLNVSNAQALSPPCIFKSWLRLYPCATPN